MKKKFLKLFLLVAISLLISLWVGIKFFEEDDDAIHIAFVGPLSGDDQRIGQSMVQAIQLYLDNINQLRSDQKIILDIIDDKNDPNEATKKAIEIVKSNAIAVIGHHMSDCSIAGGKIYKNKIPAISPASSLNELTQNNEWYFRMMFDNNLQGSFLAGYAKKYLIQPNSNISIIYTNDVYGADLARVFEKTTNKNDAKDGCTKYGCKWMLSLKTSKLKQHARIRQIVNELNTNQDDAGLIFLATQAPKGVELVKSIRDAGIKNRLVAPDSYASKIFYTGFKDEPKEQKQPGFYTDGIYVSTPFLFDTANKYAHDFNSNYKKKFQEELPFQAFYAVDAAIMLVEAIRQANIQEQELSKNRGKIQNILANKFNTPKQAVEGTTGLNYFNERNASKPISMGLYRGEYLLAAYDQLQEMPHDEKTFDKRGQVSIGNKSFHKNDVVYTGVQFSEISDFDPNAITYKLKFYLWFIAKNKELELGNIEFINAVKPIVLGTPVINETADSKYLRYEIEGYFKGNIRSSVLFTNQHTLGISFRHSNLNRTNIIYVTDNWGMDLTNNLKESRNNTNLFKDKAWAIDDFIFFQSIFKEKTLGDPKYLKSKNSNEYEYSQFNANILISNNAYFYHEIIPSQFIVEFFIFAIVMTILLILFSYKKNISTKKLKYLWFIQIILTVFLLISIEIIGGKIIAGEWFLIKIDINKIQIILTIFEILWWIIPAIFFSIAAERFVWMPLEEKTGRSIPNIMRLLISTLIYILALFGIIAFVFNRPIISLLATGGLLAGIIGLAIQMNLTNIFSGIALSLERSFRVGDWVKIGKFDEGVIVDMNWRVTQIRTRRKYILSIPNRVVSSSDIHNFSYPDNKYWLLCSIHIDPRHDPRKIEDILINAILSVNKGIVKDVMPFVRLESIQERSSNRLISNYVIYFKTENYKYKTKVLKDVWERIWVHLNQAGIIKPIDEIKSFKGTSALTSSKLEEVLTTGKLKNMIGG